MAAPIILCDCAGMDEKRWLECRDHGPKGDIEYTVGGSDVATIFGLSPWTTPLELWMIKKGRMKPKDKPNPLQLQMGHMLEPIAAHFYAQRTGDTVISDPQPVSYYTPDYVESYTVGSFDKLQICKVYCLSSEDTPDHIPTEDFQEYGRCFSLLELTKESCDEADIYTAVFREIGPSL